MRACTDQRESLLLLHCSVCDGPQDLRVEPCEARQLLGIDLIALAITMRYRSQLTDVGHDDLVTQLLELLADPDRVCPRLHRYPRWRHGSKPLLDPFRAGSEAASIDHFSFFVERAVMAPDISKVDANRHLNSGLSAGYFCDEGTRCLFHVNSLSDP